MFVRGGLLPNKVHSDVLVYPEVEGQLGDDLTHHSAPLFSDY